MTSDLMPISDSADSASPDPGVGALFEWRPLGPDPELPVPASPRYLEAAYTWAETEIAEWLSEADDEASAIVDRARAEALRLELAGYQELERLREEAVRVRMATAERVARRLSEARSDADQVLAGAGAEAEMVMDRARRVVQELMDSMQAIQVEMVGVLGTGGPACEALDAATSQLEALLEPAMLPIGEAGRSDRRGPDYARHPAMITIPGPWPARAGLLRPAEDQEVLDDQVVPEVREQVVLDDSEAVVLDDSGAAAADDRASAGAGGGTVGRAVAYGHDPGHRPTELGELSPEVRGYFQGDLIPMLPPRGIRRRLARLVHRSP